jgi:hypothetical protein
MKAEALNALPFTVAAIVLAGGPGSGVFSGLQAEKSKKDDIRKQTIAGMRTVGI